MAIVTLKENKNQQATASIEVGKGIEEIIYFPKISDSLEEDAESNLQEVWVLEGNRFEAFITESKKYDEAAAKLAEAQESENPDQIKTAQDNMRQTLVKGFGKKTDDTLDPVPQGGYKNLIECIGYVSKRTFYISNFDLKKVQNEKGKSKFRFSTNTMETIERDLMSAVEAAATDSDDGKSDDKLKNEFWEIKAEIKKEWKIAEGQVETKKIRRLITDPLIREFILTEENCELVDNAIKFFNDTANASVNQKEQKRKKITDLLGKKDGEFSHYHWGQVLIGIQEIWGKTEPDFLEEIKENFNEIPLELKKRQPLQVQLNKKELPIVIWDASAGAQLMRYTANVGAEANFDFKDKINAKVSANAKFSLLEAGAEANLYLPNNNGFKMEFNVPVRSEKLVPSKIATEAEGIAEPANFAYDSFFVLPAAILSTTKHLETLLFQKANNPNIKGVIVNIIGHTDATGSNRYNQELGKMRAQATFELFANNYAAWHGYLKGTSNFNWGTVERDFMKLTNWIIQHDPAHFRMALIDTPVGDEERMIDILKRLYTPIVVSKFPHEDLETPELVEMYTKSTKPTMLDGKGVTYLSKKLTEVDGFNPISSFEIKIQHKNLVAEYFYRTTQYAIYQTNGVKSSYFDMFYHDCVALPYLSKGESQLLENVSGKSAVNRRIELEAWQLNPEKIITQEAINLGHSRFKFSGMVSCFVGATVSLSANLEVNTPNGIVQLVGKKNKEDKVAKYDGEKIKEDEDAGNNVTAKAEAFVGAKAEAGLALALEWKNPDITIENPSADFKMLASVGGSVTGTAGAGIEGEFKIGFDQQTGTFQIKGKAQATWGFGCGGAVCFSVGVPELWEFVVLAYKKLQEHDFSFVDIFESKLDSNNNETESKIDVFSVYNSWVVEQFMNGNVLTGGIGAIGGAGILGVYALLSNAAELLKIWEQETRDKDEMEQMVEALYKRPAMASYLPPEAKGRLLYLLTQYKEITWQDVKKKDLHSKSEEAAVFLITNGIVSKRDWQETMEHMAIKSGDNYVPYSRKSNSSNTAEEKAQRAKNNVVYLRNQLLDEPEDWDIVKSHLDTLAVTNII